MVHKFNRIFQSHNVHGSLVIDLIENTRQRGPFTSNGTRDTTCP